MGQPSGEIVARPMVARACGCMCEFQHYAVDKYRAQRLAKFQKTRCADCVNKLNEQQREAAASLPTKGEALQALPPGTQMTMSRRPDGVWIGSLTANGTKVDATGDGPQGVIITLARNWIAASGTAAKPATAAPAAAKAAATPPPKLPPKPPAPAPRPVTPAPKPS
jgi:hypothetical protein